VAADASLVCRGLSVDYGQVRAVNCVDLEVGTGEIVAILGPSGSGKTTLLHAAAGFVAPNEGTIQIGGVDVSGPGWATPPERRSVGLVFQSYALWPHMNALDTVAYPYQRRGLASKAARSEARMLLERVGLGALTERRPNQLSGGEQQRVGLARALAASPALFLLDEPTANLDATIKPLLQQEIVRQQRSTGAGALYVTHDPSEAFAVAQRVAVLRAGRLLQVADPVSIYEQPANAWVAALTGPSSALAASDCGPNSDGTLHLTLAGKQLTCPGSFRWQAGGTPLAILRPEWCSVAAAGELAVEGKVELVRYQGAFTDYVVATPAGAVSIRGNGPPRFAAGEGVSWAPRRVAVVDAPDS
jgi:ABC-type Fe3+/spermidine/putrescine transport system ATPase subunit